MPTFFPIDAARAEVPTVTVSTADRLSIGDLAEQLAEPLAVALGTSPGALTWSALGRVVPRPDAAMVVQVSGGSTQARAVLLCSAPHAPSMVQRAMQRARQAKGLLGPEAGKHILEPLSEGYVRGLSYALLPRCTELAANRLAWRAQRQLLSPALFAWLRQVTAATVRPAGDTEVATAFAQPLRHMASLDAVGVRVRDAAKRAADRLESGAWLPRTVLMHGDLWKGNILLRPASGVADALRWRERFVVIDWPGAQLRGQAFYDLVRLAQSMRLPRKALRREVDRHCETLGCGRDDAMAYLLAALGQTASTLEHFPMDTFVATATSCCATLAEAVSGGRVPPP